MWHWLGTGSSSGNGHGPKPARAQGVSGQCCQAEGGLLGCPEQDQELGFNDPYGFFQLIIFWGSVIP